MTPRLSLTAIRHRPPGAGEILLDALQLAAGEACLLLGPSGSGKSTLLAIAAGLLAPQHGEVTIDGQPLAALSPAASDAWRGRRIGFVFQHLHLVPSLTVAAQLGAARHFAGLAPDPQAIAATLAALDLGRLAGQRPAALSGGEAQRVAIARAVVNGPGLILADEPTAHLDDDNAARVLDLLLAQAARCRAGLLIATHDQRARARIDRQRLLPKLGGTQP